MCPCVCVYFPTSCVHVAGTIVMETTEHSRHGAATHNLFFSLHPKLIIRSSSQAVIF